MYTLITETPEMVVLAVATVVILLVHAVWALWARSRPQNRRKSVAVKLPNGRWSVPPDGYGDLSAGCPDCGNPKLTFLERHNLARYCSTWLRCDICHSVYNLCQPYDQEPNSEWPFKTEMAGPMPPAFSNYLKAADAALEHTLEHDHTNPYHTNHDFFDTPGPTTSTRS